MADRARRAELKQEIGGLPSWTLTDRQLCDLELLLNGGFAPLTGFLNQSDYDSVCGEMRLATGALWPIPVTLDVDADLASNLEPGRMLLLRGPDGSALAVLHVQDVFQPRRELEATHVYGTKDPQHPGVAYLLQRSGPVYLGGTVEGLRLPEHFDFRDLRLTPSQVRQAILKMGWSRIVAFQTRNPMHRAHLELTLRAARSADANLLIHPVVGLTKPGDVDHYTRVRCYRALMAHYPSSAAMLALLPLAMRMAGPREAVWHALIRRNFGCTHLIIGRDHAGPGRKSDGSPFYGPYESQTLLRRFEQEIGITMLPFPMLVYVSELDDFVPEGQVPDGLTALTVSGTELRSRLALGEELPAWFTYPEVRQELQRSYKPRSRQGLTVFFTGLSGAGKSTIAQALLAKFLERGDRSVTLLDGDSVRQMLSSELGFSRDHRNLNIRRIGFVAQEVTKHGGIAICAPIAPYDQARREVRAAVQSYGAFLLVHVNTPLEVCEQRDVKGLYAKARAGVLREFTGISDPYEPPTDADLTIDTTSSEPGASAAQIVRHLVDRGYLEPELPAWENPVTVSNVDQRVAQADK